MLSEPKTQEIPAGNSDILPNPPTTPTRTEPSRPTPVTPAAPPIVEQPYARPLHSGFHVSPKIIFIAIFVALVACLGFIGENVSSPTSGKATGPVASEAEELMISHLGEHGISVTDTRGHSTKYSDRTEYRFYVAIDEGDYEGMVLEVVVESDNNGNMHVSACDYDEFMTSMGKLSKDAEIQKQIIIILAEAGFYDCSLSVDITTERIDVNCYSRGSEPKHTLPEVQAAFEEIRKLAAGLDTPGKVTMYANVIDASNDSHSETFEAYVGGRNDDASEKAYFAKYYASDTRCSLLDSDREDTGKPPLEFGEKDFDVAG